MARELTEAEEDVFTKEAEHTNTRAAFCCPHCFESHPNGVVSWTAVVIECPKCGMEFAAWLEQQTVYESAKLPAPTEE